MSEQERKQNDLYVVVISVKEERKQLYDLCVKFNIPILYPKLFIERKLHHLWVISKTGVGLVGTAIARSVLITKLFIHLMNYIMYSTI